jgi:voltage-gated sodium channel
MNTKVLQQRFMRLRSHKVFELFVVSVIIASALLVGAKTYDLHPITQILVIWFDRLITTIFLIEITIRFIGEENKKDFFTYLIR